MNALPSLLRLTLVFLAVLTTNVAAKRVSLPLSGPVYYDKREWKSETFYGGDARYSYGNSLDEIAGARDTVSGRQVTTTLPRLNLSAPKPEGKWYLRFTRTQIDGTTRSTSKILRYDKTSPKCVGQWDSFNGLNKQWTRTPIKLDLSDHRICKDQITENGTKKIGGSGCNVYAGLTGDKFVISSHGVSEKLPLKDMVGNQTQCFTPPSQIDMEPPVITSSQLEHQGLGVDVEANLGSSETPLRFKAHDGPLLWHLVFNDPKETSGGKSTGASGINWNQDLQSSKCQGAQADFTLASHYLTRAEEDQNGAEAAWKLAKLETLQARLNYEVSSLKSLHLASLTQLVTDLDHTENGLATNKKTIEDTFSKIKELDFDVLDVSALDEKLQNLSTTNLTDEQIEKFNVSQKRLKEQRKRKDVVKKFLEEDTDYLLTANKKQHFTTPEKVESKLTDQELTDQELTELKEVVDQTEEDISKKDHSAQIANWSSTTLELLKTLKSQITDLETLKSQITAKDLSNIEDQHGYLDPSQPSVNFQSLLSEINAQASKFSQNSGHLGSYLTNVKELKSEISSSLASDPLPIDQLGEQIKKLSNLMTLTESQVLGLKQLFSTTHYYGKSLYALEKHLSLATEYLDDQPAVVKELEANWDEKMKTDSEKEDAFKTETDEVLRLIEDKKKAEAQYNTHCFHPPVQGSMTQAQMAARSRTHLVIENLDTGKKQAFLAHNPLVEDDVSLVGDDVSWNLNKYSQPNTTKPVFTKVGRYKITAKVYDKAGNPANSDDTQNTAYIQILPAELGQASVDDSWHHSCEDKKDNPKANLQANGTDKCSADFLELDLYGNPISESSLSLTWEKQNLNGSYNLITGKGVNFPNGLRWDGGEPKGEKHQLSWTAPGGVINQKTLAFTSLLPSLQIHLSTIDPLAAIADVVERPTKFLFTHPTVDPRGVVSKNDTDSFTIEKDLYFTPLIDLKISDKSHPEPPSNPWSVDLSVQDCVYAYASNNHDKNLPDEFKAWIIPQAAENLHFLNKEIPPKGKSIAFSHQNRKTAEKNICFELKGAGGKLDLNFSLASKVDYEKNGHTIVYPGSSLGLDGPGGTCLYPHSAYCLDPASLCPIDSTDPQCVKTEFAIPTADIEGGTLTRDDQFVFALSNETKLKEDLTVLGANQEKDVRELVTRNAFQITRGLKAANSGTFDLESAQDKKVTYIKNDTALIKGGTLKGTHTLVVIDGNVVISGDMDYADDESILGIIVLNSDPSVPNSPEHKENGNIFVHKDVKKIKGLMFADGVLTSTEKEGSHASLDESFSREGSSRKGTELPTQLLLEGSLLSRNTLGGSQLAPHPRDGWGREDLDVPEAQKYDLHYVRRYLPVYDSTDTQTNQAYCVEEEASRSCDSNQHSFVIRIDKRTDYLTPPGFEDHGTTNFQSR